MDRWLIIYMYINQVIQLIVYEVFPCVTGVLKLKRSYIVDHASFDCRPLQWLYIKYLFGVHVLTGQCKKIADHVVLN